MDRTIKTGRQAARFIGVISKCSAEYSTMVLPGFPMDLLLAAVLLLQDKPTGRLIEQLRSEKIEERDAAAVELKRLGQAAVPDLEKALHNADPELARRAAHLLKVIQLQAVLTPDLMKVRMGIEERLAAGDLHSWTEEFFQASGHYAYLGVKEPALKEADLKALIPKAFLGAQTQDEKIKLCGDLIGARALALGAEIVPYLKDPDSLVRDLAYQLVRDRRMTDCVPALKELLKAEQGEVRGHAAWTLGALEAREAIPEVLVLLKDSDPHARECAVWTAGELNVRVASAETSTLLKDGLFSVRRQAAYALGRLRSTDAAEGLMKLLSDPSEFVRPQAIYALVLLGDKRATAEIGKLIKDPVATVREFALWALGELGAIELADEIAGRLRDESVAVRVGAIRALGQLGVNARIGDLERALKDDNYAARVNAAIALTRLGSMSGVPTILDAADRVNECSVTSNEMFPPTAEVFSSREATGFSVLFHLNALRRPEVWTKLRTKRLEGDLRGTVGEIKKQLAAESGFTTEGMGDQGSCIISVRDVPTSLLDAYQRLGASRYSALVLEPDRIRFIAGKDALAFWESWWSTTRKESPGVRREK